jgi:putative glutathione S-transferase
LPGVAETFDLDYTRLHYFASHRSINPHGILPIAPDVRFT